MKFLREKYIFVVAIFSTTICLAISGYIDQGQSEVADSLQRHNFHRAVVVSVVPGDDVISGDAATQLIDNPPAAKDGPEALLSPDSARKIVALPYVSQVMAVAKSSWQLETADGKSSEVNVFDIPPNFSQEFKLGDPALLKHGVYVASKPLRDRVGASKNQESATLGVPSSQIEQLPARMRERINWAAGKSPILLSDRSMDVPGGSALFENSLFTTDAPSKVSIGGLHLIPAVNLFVTFKAGTDVAQTTKDLESFLASATPAVAGNKLALAPMPKFFAAELGLNEVNSWGQWMRKGVLVVMALLFLIIALVRQSRVRLEFALRSAMGAGKWSAAWKSTRFVLYGITAGVFFGGILGLVIDYFLDSGITAGTAQLSVECLVLCALVALLLVASATFLGSRSLALAVKQK